MKANLEENKANKDQAHKSKTLSVDACNPCSSREDFFRAMDTNAANLPVVLSPPPRSFELVAERGRRGRGHGVRVRGGKVNKAPPPSTLPMEVDVPPSPGLSTELVASATNAQRGGRRGRGHGVRVRGGKVNNVQPPSPTLHMEVDVPPSPALPTEVVAGVRGRGRGRGPRRH